MNIFQVYQILSNHFGKQEWWPTTTTNPKFEIVIGAILTQQTSWRNVEKAIRNLKSRGLLLARRLSSIELSELETLIKPSGFYKVKARRLKNFLRFLFINYDGDLEKLLRQPTRRLRQELLSINGIGKETADSIILYAAEKPIFVVDAYTFRMCERLGITDSKNYDTVQKLFQDELPKDKNLFKEFHALIVELGKNYCKKKPKCEECPLNSECEKRLGP